MSEFYEGIEAGVMPEPVWCPGCGETIIDPAVEAVCFECDYEAGRVVLTEDLQSEDK